MPEAFDRPPLRATTLELAFEWFLRIVAVSSLMFGLLYWVRLVGIHSGAEWRFDLMPVHWRVASVTLAVLFPFAASGLWLLASWGPVIWFICAAIEVTMYLGFPELFGTSYQLVIAHACVALIYCAFRVAFFVHARRQAD